ncbi:hypothetical protein MAXJ12_33529 [Mesorhizobium alhagi CCNWXJ12-2]|uniref:Uncharacterized protein n=1 Tax=Mesorhizobium alhagi CCNWXJ12-2 TaxID=1107882 RepID=H0I2K0_9HYPH|nr:hypothetical protein MAXJ12_33529 [Mesorhizobium alhagi CCNWXJ12-2]
MAKEGLLYTSQAFLQIGPDRRHAVMRATLRELEITLTDGALSMFQRLVAPCWLFCGCAESSFPQLA